MKGVVFIFVLLCTGIGFCQNQKLIPTVLISKPLIAEIFIGFDGLGNYYYINNSVFTKQNNSKIWEYKNVAYGKITAVDIINPLKIVLFYIYCVTLMNEVMLLIAALEVHPRLIVQQ